MHFLTYTSLFSDLRLKHWEDKIYKLNEKVKASPTGKNKCRLVKAWMVYLIVLMTDGGILFLFVFFPVGKFLIRDGFIAPLIFVMKFFEPGLPYFQWILVNLVMFFTFLQFLIGCLVGGAFYCYVEALILGFCIQFSIIIAFFLIEEIVEYQTRPESSLHYQTINPIYFDQVVKHSELYG